MLRRCSWKRKEQKKKKKGKPVGRKDWGKREWEEETGKITEYKFKFQAGFS